MPVHRRARSEGPESRSHRSRLIAGMVVTLVALVPLTSGASAPRPTAARQCTVVGSSRSEVLRGTARADVICAGGGNDVILGGPGRDVLYGGPGHDWISGGRGNDVLLGGGGNDRIRGGPGHDWIAGGTGHDGIRAGAGDDRAAGGPGNDRVAGQAGNDLLFGGPGVDRVVRDAADGAAYHLDFSSSTDVGQLAEQVHHRNLIIYPPGHDAHETWMGDHNMACGEATTNRVIHASRHGESTYRCRDHFMTSMGDVDGYSIVAFSPKRTFTTARRVCWDQNLTDLGDRKWVGVHLIPARAFRGNMAYIEPTVDGVDETALPFPRGSLNFSNMNHEVTFFQGQRMVFDSHSGGSWDAEDDKATRYQHCMVNNRNGTITFRQAREGGSRVFIFDGEFPARFRLVFTDHNYTPTKDEVPVGLTWHWDNIIVA
jgi:Ca2+-binding RTX toxin-like protein